MSTSRLEVSAGLVAATVVFVLGCSRPAHAPVSAIDADPGSTSARPAMEPTTSDLPPTPQTGRAPATSPPNVDLPAPVITARPNNSDPSTPLGAICWSVVEVQIAQGELLTQRFEAQDPRSTTEVKEANADAALAQVQRRLAATRDALETTADDLPPEAVAFHDRLLGGIVVTGARADVRLGTSLAAVDELFDLFAIEFDFGAYPDSTELGRVMESPDSGCRR